MQPESESTGIPAIGHGSNQPRNNNARSYGRVHANHVDLNEVLDQPATVMGTLLVNSVPASVLFDTGASHSFISAEFAFMHGIKYEEMNTAIVVHTPAGQCQTSMVSHDVTVEIEGLEFLVSPIILKSCSIDLIPGMDWLKAHTASIVCATKVVHLLHPTDEIIAYQAHLVQNAEARLYALNALNAAHSRALETFPSFVNSKTSFRKNFQGFPLLELSNSSST